MSIEGQNAIQEMLWNQAPGHFIFSREIFKLEKKGLKENNWGTLIDDKNNFTVSQKMENRAEDITLEKITCLEHRKPWLNPWQRKKPTKVNINRLWLTNSTTEYISKRNEEYLKKHLHSHFHCSHIHNITIGDNK